MMKRHAARSQSRELKQFASAILVLTARSSSFPSLKMSLDEILFQFIRVHSRLNLFVCADRLPTSKPISASFYGERSYSHENSSHRPALYSCASEKVRRDRVVLSRSCPGPERKRHKGNFVCERRISRPG